MTLQKRPDKVNKNDYIMLTGDMNARAGNNKVTNIVGTNGKAALNNNSKKMTDFCTFNNLKIMNTFFKHKEYHKFTLEARWHKSIIDYLINKLKTSKVIQDIRVNRNTELDSDHHLLCTKVNFTPPWLHLKKKKVSVKQEEFFKIKSLNDESIP